MDQRPKSYKTLKLLEENIEGKLHDFGFGDDFLVRTPKGPAKGAFSVPAPPPRHPIAQGCLL